MASDPLSPASYDFFISYTGKDEAWAEWIAWQLKEQGYTIRFQKWHFNAGNSWVVEMQKALQQCRRMIAVLSPDYLKSDHGQAEWNVFYAKDPDGSKALLIPVRVAKTELNDLHKIRNYIDFVGKEEAACLQALLAGLKPIEPTEKPVFPAGGPSTPPAFPPTKPVSSNIPHNLPRLPHFFGRDKELKTIADALAPQARTWGALIDGPGGMGKTSLAIRAAELVPEGQFKRILFLSAKEREMSADGEKKLTGFVLPGYLEMLNEIARLLHKPELAKSPEDERARLILDALTQEHALLILDNLESLTPEHRDQLFSFLSHLPQGCKAIVTSRRRTDIDARIIRLEKLDHEAALQYLNELSADRPHLQNATEAERESLYVETGGNPLIMRWLAGQLGRGKWRTIAKALEFLRSAPPNNDPLEFIFGDLLDTFTPEETKVLAALSYFTSPMEVKFIADLAELSRTAAQTALEDLADRALVIANAEQAKFILTPLVADFLRKARPEVVQQTGDRLEQRAYAIIVEIGNDNHARFPELEAAWPGIAPALPLFLAGDNARLQTVCAALMDFFNFQGRWDEWLALSEKAEARAVAADDHVKAGWRAYHLGFIHYLRQQADTVLACADRAAAHWDRAKAGARERASAIQLRGLGHQLKKDSPAAIVAYRESLDLHRSLAAESEDVASSLNDLAEAERHSGDRTSAEEHYREAQRVARAVGDDEGVAIYTGNLAGLALDRKDWLAAETLAREALSLSEDVHRQELTALDNRRLAHALVRQGKAAEALPHARRAVEINTRLGSPNLADAQATLAECRRAISLARLNHGWTHNTTTLEGNTLTLVEVEQVLNDPAAILANRPAEHVAATRAQDAALKLLAEYLKADRDWTTGDLFRLHTVLMQGSTVDYLKPIGGWKIEDNGTPVMVAGKRVWNDAYAAAPHVSALMDVWLKELNQRREGQAQPFEDHVWLHATFVRIHPFADGNGRMARLLANLPLIAAGLDPVDIPAAARDRYLESLARWQIACGPPRPNAPLFDMPDLLADFTTLCAESRPSPEPTD